MDSLRLIYFRPRNPSWIWIRYVQHAFHKHHKNLLCRSERHSALDTKLHCDFEYFPHTSNDMLPFQHLAKPFRLKHPTCLTTTSFAAPRTNRLKAANKNFCCCVLLKKSLVIHLCALKNIVLGKLINSLKPLYNPRRVVALIYQLTNLISLLCHI